MFIQSFCSISAAGIFTEETEIPSLPVVEGQRMSCQEPDYKDIIPPMQLRRMSKPVRIGIAAAKHCLQHTPQPDAINVGTAFGMLQDSENFLSKMISQEEQMLNPTAFIQSTHNTVAGQIALSNGCNAHNMTYVHKGHSFESALLDTALLLERKQDAVVLAGAVEECTDTSWEVQHGFGIYTPEIIAGEGADFFLASARQQEDSIAHIRAFSMFRATDAAAAVAGMQQFLQQHQLQSNASDLLFTGEVADAGSREIYGQLYSRFFEGIEPVAFKSFCGEYATATAFGLSLAIASVKKENRSAWLLNHFGSYASVFYIEPVKP